MQHVVALAQAHGVSGSQAVASPPRSRRGSRAVRIAAAPTPAVERAPPRPNDLQEACTRWRAAFDAAETALSAAGLSLPRREIAARRDRIAADRADTLRLIRGIARDERVDSRFLHLTSRAGAKRLLGLPKDVRACVFNLDGVLIASAALHVAAWAQAFDELTWRLTERGRGHFTPAPFDPRTDYRRHLHARPRLDGVRSFLSSRGISLPEGDPDDPPGAESVHGLANRKNQALRRLIDERGVTAYAGSQHYLDFALETGVHTAVVSASANTHTILERSGLASRIESCIDGTAIAAAALRVKPAPDTLLAACRELGVEPAHAAAFETGAAGVEAARAARFATVIGVDTSGRADALLDAGADLVVPGLAELLERRLAP
jgi:beta-phosphoglucomutase-like phosphatase (HAD superfamily)